MGPVTGDVYKAAQKPDAARDRVPHICLGGCVSPARRTALLAAHLKERRFDSPPPGPVRGDDGCVLSGVHALCLYEGGLSQVTELLWKSVSLPGW